MAGSRYEAKGVVITFTANSYVDVYREEGTTDYSEYSEEVSKSKLVFSDVPIHITPYRPVLGSNGQTTKIVANTRKNYVLRTHDVIKTKDGRTFEVETVDATGGAYYSNSIIYTLIEHSTTV